MKRCVRVAALGALVLWGGMALAEPVSYGQALSKQKQGDWEGAITCYRLVIENLWSKDPQSILLPKSYVGCAYCAIHLGDTDLAFECLQDLWTTGAWANPNLPSSPEFAAYR